MACRTPVAQAQAITVNLIRGSKKVEVIEAVKTLIVLVDNREEEHYQLPPDQIRTLNDLAHLLEIAAASENPLLSLKVEFSKPFTITLRQKSKLTVLAA